MCQSTNRYAKPNNIYMKNYDKSIESSYLIYLDPKNLYEWAVYHKLPVKVLDGYIIYQDLIRDP